MASTIQITFDLQALDFFPLRRGAVNIQYSDGDQVFDMLENLVLPAPFALQFQEVPWINGLEDSLEANQAIRYAAAINRDYGFLGSNKTAQPSKRNISATSQDNVVTITANFGIFETGNFYSGNVLIVTIDTPTNGTITTSPLFNAVIQPLGDCSIIQYQTIASNGLPPYRIFRNSIEIQAGWNGLAQNIALPRDEVLKLFIQDANNDISDSITINVPRKLQASDFEIEQISNFISADVIVNTLSPVSGTTPLQYSIDSEGEVTGQNYQTSNSFPGVLAGVKELFVKDRFGCEIKKTINIVANGDPNQTITPDTFIISDFNTLAFSRIDNKRKGYLNTLSFDENVGIPKTAVFNFIESDKIQTQFKSSSPFHNITLFKCDGSKESLPFIMVQENIGVAEKVDCKLIPFNGQIGVYFDGGNSYVPGTQTILGDSPYLTSLPPWAEVGRFLTIDAIGSREIVGIAFDPDINRMIFLVSGTTLSIDSKVQVIFNRHNYNVFRFDFPMSKVANRGFVLIERGFSFDSITESWQSEPIRRIKDTSKHLQIRWRGFKTIENFIFDSSFEGIMWIKGRIRPFQISESEVFEGNEKTFSIQQTARIGHKVSIPLMTAKQWNKFNLVSGITQGGRLYIEDMELVRISALEAEEIGHTNYSEVTCDFGFSGNLLETQESEILLNVSTGVVGSGGSGKEPILGWQGFKRILLNDFSYLRLSEGTFISLD